MFVFFFPCIRNTSYCMLRTKQTPPQPVGDEIQAEKRRMTKRWARGESRYRSYTWNNDFSGEYGFCTFFGINSRFSSPKQVNNQIVLKNIRYRNNSRLNFNFSRSNSDSRTF